MNSLALLDDQQDGAQTHDSHNDEERRSDFFASSRKN